MGAAASHAAESAGSRAVEREAIEQAAKREAEHDAAHLHPKEGGTGAHTSGGDGLPKHEDGIHPTPKKSIVERGTDIAKKGAEIVRKNPKTAFALAAATAAGITWETASPEEKRRLERDPFGEVIGETLCHLTPLPCSTVKYISPMILGLLILGFPVGSFEIKAVAAVGGGTSYYLWKEGKL